jgi:hypothetical protein
MKSFSAKLSAFSVAVYVLAFFVGQKFGIHFAYIVFLAFFFMAFSFLLNSQLENALKSENKNQFTYTFLMLTGLKMFACLTILLVGLYFSNKESRMALGICTMFYYMLYTGFEVSHWLNKLRSK